MRLATVILSEAKNLRSFLVNAKSTDLRSFASLRMTDDEAGKLERRYFELVLRVVVVTRSSEISFGLPIASTSLPV